MWLFKCDNVCEVNSHCSHLYLMPSCFGFLWRFKSDLVVADCSHWSQGYRTPSCLYCLWCCKSAIRVASYLHWSQGYLIPKCLISLWLCNFAILFVTKSHWSQYLVFLPYLKYFAAATLGTEKIQLQIKNYNTLKFKKERREPKSMITSICKNNQNIKYIKTHNYKLKMRHDS